MSKRRILWVWQRIPATPKVVIAGLVLGCVGGQLVVMFGAHEVLSNYLAFAPAGIEAAGVPGSEIRAAGRQGAVHALKLLLERYVSLCEIDEAEAGRRKIDCEQVRRMERIPESHD